MKDCSQCGKKVEKYQRVYQGDGYCSTCYAREFKHKPCVKCGTVHRLPRKNIHAVCDACKKNDPCIRCGKSNYNIGKITQYGAVCGACAPYFRKKQPCELCGTPSSRLSRIGKNKSSKRLCPSCYNHARGFQTCPECRKYRLLVDSKKGKICKKCADLGLVHCHECNNLIPAGKGSFCDNCIWKAKLKSRVDLLLFSIKKKPAIRDDFSLFAQWLARDVGYPKAAMTIERYIGFFQEVAIHWDRLPTHEILLKHFKPKGMRKILKVKQWIESLNDVQISQNLTNDLAEQDRIRVLLSKVEANPVTKSLLAAYYTKLLDKLKSGKTTLKSVRLALQPAVGLIINLNKLPQQADVDSYLKQKSGQRVALIGFINFINQEYNLNLKIEKLAAYDKQQIKYRKKHELEKQVIDYVIECRNNPDKFNLNDWVKLALLYFHGIKVSSSNLSEFTTEIIKDGFLIKISDSYKRVFLPIID